MRREERIKWWKDGRYGMFIHWGLYSIPAGTWNESVHEKGYSEWIMFEERIPVKEYEKLADRFNPESFDPKKWVGVAKKAGMKYIVLTTKHHDGFSMFDTDYSDYSITKATPWKRDPTKELADACKEAGIKFCCYYSTDRDWYRPQGPGNRYQQTNTWDYPESTHEDFNRYYEEFVRPQVAELLTKYQPDLIWFDEIDLKSHEQVMDLHDMIREIKPDCIINSRIRGCTFPEEIPPPYCDYISSGDNEILSNKIDFEWENPASMNSSFAYNKHDHNWVPPKEVIRRLVDIVSKGGNYLLNVGPKPNGIIPQESVDSLLEAGEWLELNGEAVYGTSAWNPECEVYINPENSIYFTEKENFIYVICLEWEADILVRQLNTQIVTENSIKDVLLIGAAEEITWKQDESGLHLSVPETVPNEIGLVYRIETV